VKCKEWRCERQAGQRARVVFKLQWKGHWQNRLAAHGKHARESEVCDMCTLKGLRASAAH